MCNATGSLYAESALKIFLHMLSILCQVGAKGNELFLPVICYIEGSCTAHLVRKSDDVEGDCLRLLCL